MMIQHDSDKYLLIGTDVHCTICCTSSTSSVHVP